MGTVLVRGSSDIGSAVAHALFDAGQSVVLHDEESPPHTRRRMSFVDALFDGTTELEGVRGKRARDVSDLTAMVVCRRAVPLTSANFGDVAAGIKPTVVIDARMRKREPGEPQMQSARLTIGLGPGFAAGKDVHLAIETEWGDRLGAVIREGTTNALRGEPRELGGVGRARYVYANGSGRFMARADIGTRVKAGEIVGEIEEVAIRAPLTGYIRGICHTGARVLSGAKILEIDPREGVISWLGIGERPRRVAQGVLTAVGTYLTSA